MNQAARSVWAEAAEQVAKIMALDRARHPKQCCAFTQPEAGRLLSTQVVIFPREVQVVVGAARTFEGFGNGEQIGSPRKFGSRFSNAWGVEQKIHCA